MKELRLSKAPLVTASVAAILLLGVAIGSAQQTAKFTLTAAPGNLEIESGKKIGGWFYNGSLPGPVIRVKEGQVLEVRFINRTHEASTVHFHGLPNTRGMDGVPGISRPPVEPGQEFTYRLTAKPSGTYFFHSHSDLQLDRGLYGVLIIEPTTTKDPHFDREYTLVLDDALSTAPIPRRDPTYTHYLINGRTSAGQTPLSVKKGEKVRLRFVNASAGTNYMFAIDGHSLTVTHADGRPVKPVATDAIPIGAGERYDVIVTANNPGRWSIAVSEYGQRSKTLVRAILEYTGTTSPAPTPGFVPYNLRYGKLLSYSQLASAVPVPPIKSIPDRRHDLTLGWSRFSYVWTINGQAFPSATSLAVRNGEAVRFAVRNMTMHEHPMHLHGHFFRLLGTAGGMNAAPMKDTVLVPRGMMSGSVVTEFIADNPGSWAYHCHHLYHSEAGMFRIVEYQGSDTDRDGIPDATDYAPASAYPVLTTNGLGNGYSIASTMRLEAQWSPGEFVTFYVGPLLDPQVSVGGLGQLGIWPFAGLGSRVVGTGKTSRLDLPIPSVPALKGQRIGFQAVATHKLLVPNLRISTRAVVTFK